MIVAPAIAPQALRNNFKSPSNTPNANPRKGSINGAMIIAPMMTAVLLLIRPNVAIRQELIVSTT